MDKIIKIVCLSIIVWDISVWISYNIFEFQKKMFSIKNEYTINIISKWLVSVNVNVVESSKKSYINWNSNN